MAPGAAGRQGSADGQPVPALEGVTSNPAAGGAQFAVRRKFEFDFIHRHEWCSPSGNGQASAAAAHSRTSRRRLHAGLERGAPPRILRSGFRRLAT